LPTLHIHTDESGNFDFSPKGSRYYVFAAAWTYYPAALAAGLTALRFEQIKNGHGESLSSFHACEDSPWLRDRVISKILTYAPWSFAAIVVQKAKVNPSIYDPQHFYPKFLTMVLRFILRGRVRPGTSQILTPIRFRWLKRSTRRLSRLPLKHPASKTSLKSHFMF